MNTNEVNAQTASFVHSLKDKVNIDQIVEKVQSSQSIIIDAGLYGFVGFLIGYLIKRYSSIIIIGVLFVTALVALQQYELVTISINWAKINVSLGLPSTSTFVVDNLPMLMWEWAKANTPVVVSAVIGFLIGVKVG